MYLKKKISFFKNLLSKSNKIIWEKDISKNFNKLKKKKKIILILTIGRSGSRWLFNIFKSHKNEFDGGVERDVIYESFYHFNSYNKLKVDQKTFFLNLKNRIINDWSKVQTSVICSPYYVFGLDDILKEIKPDKIILCLNDPIFTANSFYNKDFYLEKFYYSKKIDILGLQPSYYNNLSHFFGRIVPKGKNFLKWNKLNRFGKIGWYMNETMYSLYKSLKKVDKNIYIFNLLDCDQNYNFYLSLRKMFNIRKKLSKKNFLELKQKFAATQFSKDLTFDNLDHSNWKKIDKSQFFKQTKFYRNFFNKTNQFLKKAKKII